MKKYVFIPSVLLLTAFQIFFFLTAGHAACRNPNIAGGAGPLIRRVSAARFVEIQWFGHSFFQITSSAGTRIVTDPFRYVGFPIPEVWPHVVTVGKETPNHSNVRMVRGDPLILRGLLDWGYDWNEINTFFRDVLIYNVPVSVRAFEEFGKGAAFVFEVDGLCICHTGDIGLPFNEDQLQFIGHVDILFVPIGGSYSMGPAAAKKVVEQLKPKIIVPMHYYNNALVLERFLNGPFPIRFLKVNKFSVSKDTLPRIPEIIIPKVIWYGRDDDE